MAVVAILTQTAPHRSPNVDTFTCGRSPNVDTFTCGVIKMVAGGHVVVARDQSN